MADQNKTITSLTSFSGTKPEYRQAGLRLVAYWVVFITIVAFLWGLVISGFLNSAISSFVLVTISITLLSLLSAAYIFTRKKLQNFVSTLSKASKQLIAERQERDELSRELVNNIQEIKDQRKENVRLRKELKDIHRQLEEAQQQVQEKSKTKSEFLSAISHELRTPMNAIMGMTHLLLQENPREDQLEQLEVLDFSSKSLLALITDVLDYSQIESGKIEVNAITFNLRNLIQEVKKDFHFMADKNNILLTTEIEAGIPEKIEGDPILLSQIISNLLSNALKFTQQGEVRICVKELEGRGQNRWLLFSISDTGIGVYQENQDRIFNKFTQEQNGNSRHFGGAGLGLTICKKLVELQGGEIYLKSEKNVGSTFFVKLSFTMPSDEQISGSSQSTPPSGKEGATVLLVEDNPVNQTVMQRFLDKWSLQTLVAEDGAQALEVLEKEKVDLILMDLQMPVMDGYEATRKIRSLKDPHKARVPVIALTAASLQEVKEEALSVGMNDFLTKPFNPVKLQHTLEQYLNSTKPLEPH